MKILLTGATGFLGSALARHWVHAGHDVCALVRPRSATLRLDGVLSGLTLVQLDRESAAEEAVHVFAPDAVVHTACAYGRRGETPGQIHQANVAFGVRLLDALAARTGPRPTFLNTGTVLAPDVSLYAFTKRHFSAWGARAAEASAGRVSFVNAGLQHMYGPDDDASKFTTHVMRACLRDEPELELTAGEQMRDFIYIDDVVSAYDTLLAAAPGLAASESFDVGSGEAPTLRAFVETIHALANSQTRLMFGALPYRANEAMNCVANTTRLRALGWKPAHTLTSGLQATLLKERLK